MTKQIQYKSADEAVKAIQSNQRVFVHGSAATPLQLAAALARRADELKDVELVSVSTLGSVAYADSALNGSFFINSLFVSESIRKAVNSEHGDYIPIFLSEIPTLFRTANFKLDVALIHVSTPDRHGYCSLGVSVDVARAAVQEAKHIIAQVNPQMPRTHGDGLVHINQIHSLVAVDEPLPEVNYNKGNEVAKIIGQNCANLIEDGATLQMGIGEIPDAVLSCLSHHKDLGVHTEMFSNGILPLVEKGVINNRRKSLNPGKIVAGFVVGSRDLYDFVDDNPEVVLLDISYVNDPAVIKRNPKVVAINSAIEIDLTGQVCADSIGTVQYSGVGGQMDFLRGAALSPGGKPIIALPSVTDKGISKITPFLKPGAGVVTTRAHVHYVVTEYGVAYLFGKNLRQRASALINIAHPDHRESLEKAAYERFGRL